MLLRTYISKLWGEVKLNNFSHYCVKQIVLIKNELKKCVSKRSVFVVFLLILFSLLLLAAKVKGDYEGVFFDDIQEYYESEIRDLYDSLDDSTLDLDDEQKQLLLDQIRVDEYMRDHRIAPYKTQSSTNYLLEMNSWFAIVVLLSIVVSGKMITDEYKYGTISLLLTTPNKRGTIFISKVIALMLLCGCIVFVFIVMSIVFGGLFWNIEGVFAKVVTIEKGNIQCRTALMQMLKKSVHNFLALATCAMMTMMLSVICKNGIISTCVSSFIYLSGAQLTIAFRNSILMKYTLFPNMQLQAFEHMKSEFSYRIDIRESACLLVAYSVLFFIISYVVFCRRNIYE